MISISYVASPKGNQTYKTSSGIFGIGQTGNDSTQNGNISQDTIKAMTMTTNYLNVLSNAVINNLSSSQITTNSISGTNANLSYITTYSLTATDIESDNLGSSYGYIDNLVSQEISVKDLTVTGSAHFFELVIDKVKSAGGQVIFSSGDGFKADFVEETDEYYSVYWKADDGTKAISNNLQTHDLVICRNFNEAEIGTNTNVSNKYYWAEVVESSENPVLIDNSYYHYIHLYKTGLHDGTLNPEVGDEIAMLGNTQDASRQSAIYIAAGTSSLDSGLQTPLFAQYQGINGSSWDLKDYRKSFFDRTTASFVGNFKVSTTSGDKDIKDYIDDEISYSSSEGIKGDDGISAYNIIFNNQMLNVQCDYEGNVVSSEGNAYINAYIYYGTTQVSAYDISAVTVDTISGLTWQTPAGTRINTSIDGIDIFLPYSMISASSYDNSSFMLNVTLNENYDNTTIKGNFYINKIKAGENGVTSPIYEFTTTTPYIKVNKNGVITSPSDGVIRFGVNKIYNNETSKVVSLPDGYKIVDYNGTTIYFSGDYGMHVSLESNLNYYWTLYQTVGDTDIVVDYLEIPKLEDGEDGTKGADGISYILTPHWFTASVGADRATYFYSYGTASYVMNGYTYNMTDYKVIWETDGDYSGYAYVNGGNYSISEALGNYDTDFSYIGTCVRISLLHPTTYNVLDTKTTSIIYNPSASINIDSKLNTITAQVQSNTRNINSNYSTLSNSISSLELTASSIQSSVDEIETTMDSQSTEITYIKNNYSTIEQTADKIESTVGSISIGGVNILDRTDMLSTEYMFSSAYSSNKFAINNSFLNNVLVDVSYSGLINSYYLQVNAESATIVSGQTAKYIDIIQNTTEIESLSYYTLSLYYKGWYYENTGNPFTGENQVGAIYITDTNPTWQEVDDVTGVLQNDLYTPIYDTDNSWKKLVLKFKTGEITQTNRFYIRVGKGQTITIAKIKLEEGKIPTAWCTSEDDVKSNITQTANNISLEITNGLESTGIHIDEHYITLDGNTKVIGNLNIHNSDAGIVLYDTNDNPTVQIQPTPIGDLEDAQQSTLILPNVSLSGTVAASTSKTAILPIIPIGDVTSGDVLVVSKMLAGVSLTVPYASTTYPSCTYKFEYVVLNSSNAVQSVQYTKTGTCSNIMWSIPEFTATTTGKFGIRVSLTFTNTNSNIANFLASTNYMMLSKRISKIIKIGYDGMYSSFDNGSMFWVDENNIQLRQNAVNSNGLYTPKGLIVNNEYDVPMIIMGRQIAVSGTEAFDRVGPVGGQHNNTLLAGEDFNYVYDSVFASFGWKSSKWTGTAWQTGSSGYNYVYDVKSDDDIITITSTHLFNTSTFDTVNIVPYIRLIKNNTEDAAVRNVMNGREITIMNLSLTSVYIVSCRTIGFAGDIISSDTVNDKPYYNIMGTGTSTTLSNRIELAKGGVAKLLFLGNGLWKRII